MLQQCKQARQILTHIIAWQYHTAQVTELHVLHNVTVNEQLPVQKKNIQQPQTRSEQTLFSGNFRQVCGSLTMTFLVDKFNPNTVSANLQNMSQRQQDAVQRIVVICRVEALTRCYHFVM